MEERERIISALFYTYGGRYVTIKFDRPYMVEGSNKRKLMERLADTYAQLTQHTDDPIVKCSKLISD